MSRATKCAACVNDMRYMMGKPAGPLPDVHRPPNPWWEREPGWVRDDIRRALIRPRVTPGYWLVCPTPVARMSPKQLLAELGRQSKRLANALVGDFAGPRAAEQYIVHRRAELGLDDTPNLFLEVA